MMHWLRAGSAVLLLGVAVGIGAADWFPYPVERWPDPADELRREAFHYQPLHKAEQNWRLCVTLPHRKDDYWRAVEWGLLDEAKRIGVQLDLLYAGGYDQRDQQIRQLRERCNDGRHDAVLIGAIDERRLNETLVELHAAGLPIIDLVNGIDSPHVTAKSLVSFYDMGAAAARYVNELCVRERRLYRIGWFPGPDGAGWVRQGDEGFRATLDPACGRIVHIGHGDTGLRVQMALIERALKAVPDIDLIVGTAVTAEAASYLARRHQPQRMRAIAYYLNASVYRGLRADRILAAPTDSPVVQGRIAIDLAVRVLEKKPFERRVGPRIVLLDRYNVFNFYPDFALAPADIPP